MKKKLFIAALAVCLVAIVSMSTLAWFTANDTATNQFFVTNSDEEDPDKIFSVDVTENVADPGEDPVSVDGYEFEDILPGDKLVKQPFVTNTGSYDQFIRVTITISDFNAFEEALGDYPVASLFANLNWGYEGAQLVLDSHKEDRTGDGTLTYVFYVNEIVEPGESIRLFDKVLIPTQLDQADFAETSLSDGFSIDIFAEAVQTENVGTKIEDLPTADASNAKAAFEYVAFFS